METLLFSIINFAFSNWFLLYLHFLRFLIFWAIGRGWWGPLTIGALSFLTNPTQWALRQYLSSESFSHRLIVWTFLVRKNMVCSPFGQFPWHTTNFVYPKFDFRQKRSLHDRCHESGSATWPPRSKRPRQGGGPGLEWGLSKQHDKKTRYK
jgi:hypothetical protein